MNVQMLMGETLFDIESPLPIRWRKEEVGFVYHGEPFRQRITVHIHMVSSLPGIIDRQVYQAHGIRFGFDTEGREVRAYNAPYIAGDPTYAESVLDGSAITIYFLDDPRIWYNPNVRFWNLVHMERLLLRVGALVLHCSYLMYENRAILFSAPCGTGKTTQAKLWEKLYPATIINGDKAIIQKKGNTWFACGYPFHGSADECRNEDYPIEAVVVVRQNPRDYIETMRTLKKVQYIYSETTVAAWDPVEVETAFKLIEELVCDVQVVCQQCTMNDEACHTLHRYLKEN